MGLQKQLRFQVLDETTEILLIIKAELLLIIKALKTEVCDSHFWSLKIFLFFKLFSIIRFSEWSAVATKALGLKSLNQFCFLWQKWCFSGSHVSQSLSKLFSFWICYKNPVYPFEVAKLMEKASSFGWGCRNSWGFKFWMKLQRYC